MIRVLNSIARELVTQYPTAPVYAQKIPVDFTRPSFFIQFVAGDTEELNAYKRRDNMTFQIVYFGEQNDNDIVNVDKQLGEIERIKKPFKTGMLKIENTERSAKITGIRTSLRDDEIMLDLDLYIDDLEPLDGDDDDGGDGVLEKMGKIYFEYATRR